MLVDKLRMGVDSNQAGIQRTCLDLMYGQTRTAWLSNAFCTALLWVAFWDNADHTWLLGWSSIGVILMAAREIQSRRYANRAGKAIDLVTWTRWLEVSLFANGLLWGIGCATLTLIATPYQWPVILLVAGGLQTGSVLASSYLMRAFTLFWLPLFLCTLLAFLVLGFGSHPGLLVTAALLGVWSVFIFVCASRFGKHYRRSVGFALENLNLVKSLESKYEENEILNQSLHERIDELDSTQRQLLLEKDRSDGLVEKLRELSLTDGLTGLGNRRYFDEKLSSEWRRATRNDQPLALVLADVDHFKAFNDHYGHQEGDRCLVDVARVLARVARREGDWVSRYGGEEFALIFANTSLDTAVAFAERVREDLLACAIEHSASPVAPHVSLSLGVAAIVPDDAVTPEALVAAADEALYVAKQNGRNQVLAGTALAQKRTYLA